ncbi:Mor transcription activator family protein [Candidatus Aalborgicola defluviihabitans]|uniref:Mor transcription activator family protein n=1 Tax=Candidatus Aalborgicola defluviihabitans TaxID=3386187 RepID=UPI0039B86824
MLEAEQLAPFDALVDQAYPDNLRMVAEWLYVQLVEDEEIAETPISAERLTKLALLALRQTERLSAEIGGGNFYLAKGVSCRASLRDREMFERFNGRNYDTLARAYNLTPMRVRQIIGAMMADEIARRQGKLELG